MRRLLVHIVLIAALGFLAYSNTFYGPLQFDESQIIDNPVIKDLKNFTSDSKGYDYNPRGFINPRRLVGYLSFALNYHFGGLDVTGYHVVNLLIHIANALLVYFLVFLTFRTPYFSPQRSTLSDRRSAIGDDNSPQPPLKLRGGAEGGGVNFTIHDSRSFIALFSALLFVSHPLQTQAVTHVIQRFTSLATLFYLLSLVMYIKGRLGAMGEGLWEKPLAHRLSPIAYFFLSLLSAVLAMKTKEIAFTFPIIIVLYEFTFFRSSLRKKLLFLIPVLLTIVIIPISMMHTDKPLGEILSDLSEKTRVHTQMSRWEYLTTEMRVIVTYIRLIFMPINQNLDYDYPVYHSFLTPQVFMSFLFLSAIFGTAGYLLCKSQKKAVSDQRSAISDDNSPQPPLKLRGGAEGGGVTFAIHYSRLIGFGIFWFFITLSVESSFIPIADVIVEHRLYLPLAGAFVAITTGVLIAAKRLKIEKIVIPVLVLITLLLSGLTYARNALWNDEISLWQDVVTNSPNKDRPHNNLGFAYASQGLWDRAIAEYQTALRLNPDYVDAHNNLGLAYASQGQLDRAIAEYQTALRLKPDVAEAHNNLGVAYASQGQLDMAIAEYQAALRLKPDYAKAHSNLGITYADQGLWDRAIAEYLTALRLKPDLAEAHNNLGNAYASQGQLDRAIAEYQTALRLKPDYAKAHNNLGLAYASQGRLDKAIAEYQTALRLKPDFYEARQRLNDIASRRR